MYPLLASPNANICVTIATLTLVQTTEFIGIPQIICALGVCVHVCVCKQLYAQLSCVQSPI